MRSLCNVANLSSRLPYYCTTLPNRSPPKSISAELSKLQMPKNTVFLNPDPRPCPSTSPKINFTTSKPQLTTARYNYVDYPSVFSFSIFSSFCEQKNKNERKKERRRIRSRRRKEHLQLLRCANPTTNTYRACLCITLASTLPAQSLLY